MTKQRLTQEHRREPRLETLNLVNVAHFDESRFKTESVLGRTIDLSHNGVRLQLDHALPLKSVVELTIALDEELVGVRGVVRHLELTDDSKVLMGLEFTTIDDEARDAIHRYLQEHGDE